jgi:hypothetical protein
MTSTVFERPARRRVAATLAMAAGALGLALVAPTTASAATEPVLRATVLTSPTAPVVDGPAVVFVTVSNDGLDAVTGVRISVDLPAGATVGGTGCTSIVGGLTCTVGELAPKTSRIQRIDLADLPIGAHPLVVTTVADQPGAAPTEPTTEPFVVRSEEADLAGNDLEVHAPVGARQHVQHTFRNNGPTAAWDATVTGTFPAGSTVVPGSFRWGDAQDVTARCTVTATTFTCGPTSTDPVQSTNFLRYTITYSVDLPSTPGTVVASAVAHGRNDPDHANDESAVTFHVEPPAADLVPTLPNAGSPTLVVGQPRSFSLQVRNQGHQAAPNVTATISASSGWSIEPLAGGVYPACVALVAGATVRCSYPTSGTNGGVLHGGFRVIPTSAGAGTLRVDVAWPTTGGGTATSAAVVDATAVATGADLGAGASQASPSSGRVDQPYTATWRWTNASTNRVATGAAFETALPPGSMVISTAGTISGVSTIAPSGPLSCTGSVGAASSRCATSTGNVFPGQTVTMTVTALVTAGGVDSLDAVATQASVDPVPTNDVATAPVAIAEATAGLRMVGPTTIDDAEVGEPYQYVVSVESLGPDRDVDVRIDGLADPGVEVLSAAWGWFGRPCQVVQTSTLRCDLPNWQGIDAGPPARFVVVTARSTVAGNGGIRFTASGGRTDPDPSDDTITVRRRTVAPEQATPVDLGFEPVADLGSLPVGSRVERVIPFVNRSTTRTATNVRVGLDDPTGRLRVLSARMGWFSRPCTISSTATRCAYGTLGPGAIGFVVVTVEVRSAGALDLAATLTTDQPDADPTSNQLHLTGTGT